MTKAHPGNAGVEWLEASAHTVPTDSPEADGTLAWDSTTMVLVRAGCGEHTGIGWTYGPPACAAVVQEYIEHYNTHRPHRSLRQRPPTGATPPPSKAALRPLRRDRLGGLVHEYVQVA